MTDIIKPFEILSTRLEHDGSTGVDFKAEKIESISLMKRRRKGITGYISVPAGMDVDQAVFDYLQDSGWLG